MIRPLAGIGGGAARVMSATNEWEWERRLAPRRPADYSRLPPCGGANAEARDT